MREGEGKKKKGKKLKNSQTKPRNKVKPSQSFGLDASCTRSKAPPEEKSWFKRLCFQPVVQHCFALGRLWIKAVGQRHLLLMVYMLLD